MSEFDLLRGLDVNELQACLERLCAVMFIKMHYFHRNSRPILEGIGDESRVRWLDEEELPDVNKMLPHVDVLITDYSSVYLDYLLLNRPVIFAPFDRDRYLATDREFYEAYDAVTPGPKCANWLEVIAELTKCLNGHDVYEDARRSLRGRYHAHMDTANCRRVVEAAKELLADNHC